MLTSRALRIFALGIFLAATLATTGCQSRAASAEKLLAQGEYEKVIAKYPDLEVAQRARAKMADKLLQEKKYDVILKQYADTRAAFQAKIGMADQAFKDGKYQMVIDSFPSTPAATSAKAKIADSLYQAGKYDELVARFGDTPQAIQVKEKLAADELDQAKKLRGEAKKLALEQITKKYPGTNSYKEASTMLADIRAKETAKKK
jgi:hypothetical protein